MSTQQEIYDSHKEKVKIITSLFEPYENSENENVECFYDCLKTIYILSNSIETKQKQLELLISPQNDGRIKTLNSIIKNSKKELKTQKIDLEKTRQFVSETVLQSEISIRKQIFENQNVEIELDGTLEKRRRVEEEYFERNFKRMREYLLSRKLNSLGRKTFVENKFNFLMNSKFRNINMAQYWSWKLTYSTNVEETKKIQQIVTDALEEICRLELELISLRKVLYKGEKSFEELSLEKYFKKPNLNLIFLDRCSEEYSIINEIFKELDDAGREKMYEFEITVLLKFRISNAICQKTYKLKDLFENPENYYDPKRIEDEKQNLLKGIKSRRKDFEEYDDKVTVLRKELFNNEKPEWELKFEHEFGPF